MLQRQNMTDVFSFLIRAVQLNSDESPPSAAMYTDLIEITHCWYDLNEPAFEDAATVGVEDVSSKRKGKKRASSSKTSQVKRKRKS